MTLEEALDLKEGSRIASPLDSPPYRIRKVKRVWSNDARTDVRVILAGTGEKWIAPFAWVVVPAGAIRLDDVTHAWVRVRKGVIRPCGKPVQLERETLADAHRQLDRLARGGR